MFGFSGRALHTTLGWWPTDQVIASKDRSWKFDELSRRQLQCLPNVNSSNETAALINVKYTHWISCPNHSKNWKVKSAWKFHRIGRQQLPCMPYLSSGQPTELPTRKYFIKEGNLIRIFTFVWWWWWTNSPQLLRPYYTFHQCVLGNKQNGLEQGVSETEKSLCLPYC